jgi:hypothetical protein
MGGVVMALGLALMLVVVLFAQRQCSHSGRNVFEGLLNPAAVPASGPSVSGAAGGPGGDAVIHLAPGTALPPAAASGAVTPSTAGSSAAPSSSLPGPVPK